MMMNPSNQHMNRCRWMVRCARILSPLLVMGWVVLLSAMSANGATPLRELHGKEHQVPSAKWPTLAIALKAINPGDTLVIRPGIYRERLKLTRPVHLRALSNAIGSVVIDGGGEGRTIEIFSPGVSIQHLDIRGSGDTMDPADACVYGHEMAAGLVIQHNRLSDCAFGIWINGAPDVQIIANEISGRAKPIFSDRGNGINLWQVKRALVQGNRIHTTRDGILITVSSESRVVANRMWKVRFGIHYMYNDDNWIEENVTCNSLVGLAMMFSKRLVISRNTVVNNRDHGLFLRSIFDSRIENNHSQGNHKGLVLNEASYNTITGNQVANNQTGVEVTGGSEDNRITRNNFLRNLLQVKYTWRRPQNWDHEKIGNYWSDYLGWDLNRDQRGDLPYYSTNRVDWLLQRYPQVKLLAASPMVGLMQLLESRFPVLRPAGVVDRFPSLDPINLGTLNAPDGQMECGEPGSNREGGT